MATKASLSNLRRAVEAQRERIVEIGRFIHANPELGLAEVKAAKRIMDYLRDLGFEVEAPYVGMETAFRAVLRGKGDGPTIGVLAEYDALAGVGHACGHNLITVAASSAATAMADCRDAWPGTFEIIGTPAEEMLAGKCDMVERGAFSHLDASFMTHPLNGSTATPRTNALRSFTATFRGKAAHAAGAPEHGINALDAAILFFNGVNALRQHLREDARVHGIITDGGQAANVIPERAAVQMVVRSQDEDDLGELCKRVETACRAAAKAIGARVTVRWDKGGYRAFRVNAPLERLLIDAYGRVGIPLAHDPVPNVRASLDMGNVSRAIPAAHPFFSICPDGPSGDAPHTRSFAKQADTDYAYEQALQAGAAMALVAVRLLGDRGALDEIKAEFARP